ncbi:MAG: hypothetical protein Ctma_0763 [Catillopecten margaritatus gill symbiont]|uniref:Cytochrome P460 domain-containing protein n=1 Tax=Catillopecten margaritatus gill symbiont TaxID=3083288 RepID=A0AAU6PGD7_9GAMM
MRLGLLLSTVVLFAGCSADYTKISDNRWAGFKNWTKITEGKTATGDTTGFVGNVHKGRNGYRDVYVNDIGAKTLQGSAPYNLPVGTVIVKEQFDDLKAFKSQKPTDLTIMVKLASSKTPSAKNWGWIAGQNGKVEQNNFCIGCHTIAAKDDFVFTTGDFLRKH